MAGPDPRYTVKAIVLARHGDIMRARQLMRTWPDITEALGFDRTQWKQVSACFRRVDAAVKAGKLKPSGEQAQRKQDAVGRSGILGDRSQQRKSTGTSTGASAVIDLDYPANQ